MKRSDIRRPVKNVYRIYFMKLTRDSVFDDTCLNIIPDFWRIKEKNEKKIRKTKKNRKKHLPNIGMFVIILFAPQKRRKQKAH